MSTFPVYTRTNPSPQFDELISMYKRMHSEGYETKSLGSREAKDTFPGDALPLYADIIRDEIQRTNCTTLLDYGAGKASYFKHKVRIELQSGEVINNRLQDFWGVDVSTFEPALGDPVPTNKFDCVVNADVLEHIFISDLPWVIDEIFSLARKFVFVNIACYPAQARLPTGEDAHITVRTPDFWRGMFDTVASKHQNVDFVIACSTGWGRGHAKIFRRVDGEGLIGAGQFSVP